MMFAPWLRVASSLPRGASSGITMVAAAPTCLAAIATACAWLPEENATTPRARSSSGMDRIRLLAPRILNAPPRWRFSHLKWTSTPAARLILVDENTGKRRGQRCDGSTPQYGEPPRYRLSLPWNISDSAVFFVAQGHAFFAGTCGT